MSEISTHMEIVSGKAQIKVEFDPEGAPFEKVFISTTAPANVKNEFVPEEINNIGKENDFFNITEPETGEIYSRVVDIELNDVATERECFTFNVKRGSSAEWETVLIKEENIEGAEGITHTLADSYSVSPFENVGSEECGKCTQIREKIGKNYGNRLESEVGVFPFHVEEDNMGRNSGKETNQITCNDYFKISAKNLEKAVRASVGNSSVDSFETLNDLVQDNESVQIVIKKEELGNEFDPEASDDQSYSENAESRLQTVSCEYCFAEFRTSSEMECHMSTHIGEQLSSGAPKFPTVKIEVADRQCLDPIGKDATQLSDDKHSTVFVPNQGEVAAASPGHCLTVSFKNPVLKRDISPQSVVRLEASDLSSKNKLDAKVEPAYTKVQFPCKHCLARFGTCLELERHVLVCTGEQLSSSMPVTLKTSSDIRCGSDVKRHSCNKEQRSGNVRRFPCVECDKTFSTRTHLKRHSVIHSGQREFACAQCPAAFKTSYQLTQHSRAHSDVRNFACKQCTATFKSKQCLQRHLAMHSNVKMYQCPECANTFKYMSSMKRHLRIHSNWKLFAAQCPAYESKVESLPSVQLAQDKQTMQSAKSRSTKQLSCAHCNATFNLKSLLIAHLTVHSPERPYRCPECSRGFKSKSDLTEHAFIHSKVKRYSCGQCTAAFHSRSSMIRHSAVHSDDKPFVCAECPAAFKTKGEVKMHSVVHSSEGQFSCAFCSARFKHQHNLHKHLPLHSNKERVIS